MIEKFAEIINRENKHILSTYKRIPVEILKGEGCYLYTRDNRKILDLFGGLAVNLFGYRNETINNAIVKQIENYIHISNYFFQPEQIYLAEKLKQLTGFEKVFFANSGTEAIEAAIKISRKYFLNSSKNHLFAFSGSFHGRTLGSLSLTARYSYREQFQPLLPNVIHINFNSIDDLLKNINQNTAAIFIECIQGEGGIIPANDEFIKELNILRNKYNFLIIADEIQSGMGRTGSFCAYTQFGLNADIIVLAKGLGGGLPLGAVIVNKKLENIFDYGEHGSTFGGNPAACAAGNAVLSLLNNQVLQNNIDLGYYLNNLLIEIQKKYIYKIKQIRGRGLMIGIEVFNDANKIAEELLNENILVNVTNKNVIRLLPPYIITKNEINSFIKKFDAVLSKL